MNEFDEIWEEAYYAPHGTSKMQVLKRGYELADQLKDYENQMEFREEYMSECAFHDDVMLLYVVFPEYLRLYDEGVKNGYEDTFTYQMMFRYKWVIENARNFYQISESQFQAFLKDYKRRCLENGYTLRTYYQFKSLFYMFIDMKKAEAAYDEFLKCKRDELSDCKACERNQEVFYLLKTGQKKKADIKAKPLFFRIMSCEEVPELTYGAYLHYYNKQIAQGDTKSLKHATECVKKLTQSISRKKIGQEFIGQILLFYALTEPPKALSFYKKYWEFFENNRNPVERLEFSLGAVTLFGNMAEGKSFRMNMPKNYPLYREDGVYEVNMLLEYYKGIALDIAQKMDKRNGNGLFVEMLGVFLKG